MKIIFLFETRPTARDFERFGVDLLKQKGVGVFFWDFTPVVNREYYEQYQSSNIAWDEQVCRLFKSKTEILEAIATLDSSTFVVNMITLHYKNYWFFRALGKTPCKRIIMKINITPFCEEKNFFEKLNYISNKKGVFKYFSAAFGSFMHKLPVALFGVRKHDYVIMSGEKAPHFLAWSEPSKNIIWTHSYDYDRFLVVENELKDAARIVSAKNIVFLDEYVPFHPDNLTEGTTPIHENDYFPPLRNLFDAIEKITGLKIIIAAHPRSEYEKHPGIWGDRQVIRGQTNRLVKDAEMVIGHSSVSMNFAMLWKKPIIFCSTRKLDQHYGGRAIRLFADALGMNILFADDFTEDEVKTIIEQARQNQSNNDRYIHQYIKNPVSPAKFFWDIVSTRLEKDC